jgi:SAM-dependent methyltransferase
VTRTEGRIGICLQDVESDDLKHAPRVCKEEIHLMPCELPMRRARRQNPRIALHFRIGTTSMTTPLQTRHRRRALTLAGLLALACTGVAAQPETAAGPAPRRGQAGKDVVWIATPDAAVDRMLRMAEVHAADRVVDLGSGDGRIAIAAGRDFGARATGLEFDSGLVAMSVRRAREAGVADRVDFRRADLFATDFTDATVVTMYLLPELNLRLRPVLFRMAPGTRVVSHSFAMGDWRPDETSSVGNATLHLWRVPANAGGVWRVRAPSPGPGGASSGTSGLPATPGEFRFAQRFQRIEGDASFGPLTASAIRPELSGDALSFALRDGDGALLHVRSRIAGDRMTGTLTRDAGAALAFDAERVGEAPPIDGVEATQAERDAAARVLN